MEEGGPAAGLGIVTGVGVTAAGVTAAGVARAGVTTTGVTTTGAGVGAEAVVPGTPMVGVAVVGGVDPPLPAVELGWLATAPPAGSALVGLAPVAVAGDSGLVLEPDVVVLLSVRVEPAAT